MLLQTRLSGLMLSRKAVDEDRFESPTRTISARDQLPFSAYLVYAASYQ